MKHEVKKICKIVDEMTTLLLQDDTDQVDLRINKLKDRTIISMVDYNTNFDKERVDSWLDFFNVQRQHELEEYYWQLLSQCDNDSELTIIGAMVDKATIELKDNNMYIELVRINSKEE